MVENQKKKKKNPANVCNAFFLHKSRVQQFC